MLHISKSTRQTHSWCWLALFRMSWSLWLQIPGQPWNHELPEGGSSCWATDWELFLWKSASFSTAAMEGTKGFEVEQILTMCSCSTELDWAISKGDKSVCWESRSKLSLPAAIEVISPMLCSILAHLPWRPSTITNPFVTRIVKNHYPLLSRALLLLFPQYCSCCLPFTGGNHQISNEWFVADTVSSSKVGGWPFASL